MAECIAFIIDPPSTLQTNHDSTLAMIMACHRRSIDAAIIEPHDIYVEQGAVFARVTWLNPVSSVEDWYSVADRETLSLSTFDCVMMRKDPPCDPTYLKIAQILSIAKRSGVRVVNDPDALCLLNEKSVIELFPQCIAPTLIGRDKEQLKAFIAKHEQVVLKPLDGMGGRGIFNVQEGDLNINTILETLLSSGFVMAQRYLKEIEAGDKRILVIHGEAFPYALARIPKRGEFRGNLAVGGRGVAKALSEQDRYLVAEIRPFLLSQGLSFVGLDVIGDYITEINITSPTCIQELDAACKSDIAGLFIDGLVAEGTTR